MYQPQTNPPCRTCGVPFPKQWMRQVHCSFRCAYWGKVQKRGPDECWPWQGGLVNGYGGGTFNGERYKVSRQILAEKLGRPLGEGMFALHTCDNPPCCNPSHLWEGTNADNMKDKTVKGRGSSVPPMLKGEAHGKARLTEQDVRFIWANRHLGQSALGRQLGVQRGVIDKIFTGRTWGWLTSTIK